MKTSATRAEDKVLLALIYLMRANGTAAASLIGPPPTALPSGPGTYNATPNDAFLFVPSVFAVGNPALTVNLPASPQDGQMIEISDPFGKLNAGTVLVVAGNGHSIADGGPAAPTQTYNTPGIKRKFVFSVQASPPGGFWIVVD